MFYQIENSVDSNNFKVIEGENFNFPKHLHGDFEFITVVDGEMTVTVEKKAYTLKSEDALLIFPNQAHDFYTPIKSRHILCIFSPALVQVYSKAIEKKIPADNRFRVDPFFMDRLKEASKRPNLLFIKGVLYSLCSDFDNNRQYNEHKSAQNELLKKIFQFVENNYNKKCSLKELALHTARHYTYLSKLFKEATGFSFSDYVCKFRIRKACYMLQYETQKVLEVAYDCGFDSLRSFNRNFKSETGKTPVEYRKNFHCIQS